MEFFSSVVSGGEKSEDVTWLSDQMCNWLSSKLEQFEVDGKIERILFQPICLPKDLSHFEESFAVRERGALLHICPEIDYDAFEREDRASASALIFSGLVEGIRTFLGRGRYKQQLIAIIERLEEVQIDRFVASIADKKMDLPKREPIDPMSVERLEALLESWPDGKNVRDRKTAERLLVRLKEGHGHEG
ncbi:hypothetical protein [Qipengyuania gelatinilytica]|uniref:DUF4194 domain-containing protein n=1 Tax=Qipengyuania gelatinilytica TaxID=2867231 RepID=A0ABX9A2T4_9SPHN|nr:hypothetical protein [Qipengyuania gelatinilytica]QZD95585.1 hypothetical protein K3136_02325 [Qipengyuania gelatinilytica]